MINSNMIRITYLSVSLRSLCYCVVRIYGTNKVIYDFVFSGILTGISYFQIKFVKEILYNRFKVLRLSVEVSSNYNFRILKFLVYLFE